MIHSIKAGEKLVKDNINESIKNLFYKKELNL